MSNSFGHLFRITTWGESHGGGVGVVVDGCPPRLKLTVLKMSDFFSLLIKTIHAKSIGGNP